MEKGLISIDKWADDSQAYFLTHLHADHTRGLSPKWAKGPLFCSPISAALFPFKFPGFDLSLLRVLEVGSTVSLSLVSPNSGDEVEVHVTSIDAHHCPGAVMYLFKGEFGCVLYTGDFRWEPTSEKAQLGKKTLLKALKGDNLDVLYLDNTYCNPSFSFPPREVAAKQVIDIIAQHPDHEIIIGIDTLGKEDLLLQIADALNIKIWVWPERLRTMHILGFFDVFTTKTCLTRVRAVPRYNVTFDTLDGLNTLHPTIGIIPSGLPWMKPGSLGNSMSEKQYFFPVPYSEHSCFSEIQEFIKIVQPSTVTGIVSSSFCYINPRQYFRRPYGDTHLTYKPEKVEARQNKSSLKSEARKQVKMKSDSLTVRRSRICILRRKSSGVKLEEQSWLRLDDADHIADKRREDA